MQYEQNTKPALAVTLSDLVNDVKRVNEVTRKRVISRLSGYDDKKTAEVLDNSFPYFLAMLIKQAEAECIDKVGEPLTTHQLSSIIHFIGSESALRKTYGLTETKDAPKKAAIDI